MASPSQYFPSTGMQTLSALIHFLGVTVVTHCLSRRLAALEISFSALADLSWSRICILLVFIDSWLFLFLGGVLIFGVGLELSHSVCDAAILLCIIFYATSKILIYFFLIERVHVVWAPRTGAVSRFKSPVDRLCFITVGTYAVVIALMLVGRISELREPKKRCIIGLKPLSSIPLLSYDIYINCLLTVLFFWPLWKAGRLSSKVKRLAIRALIATVVSLTTSTVNIAILASRHGKELGWVCLGACGADVIVNALALYWATLPKKQRSQAPTLNFAASKDLGSISLFTVTRDGAPKASTIRPPQAARFHNAHNLDRRISEDYYTNPFLPPRFTSKQSQRRVQITAEPQLAAPVPSRGILKYVSDHLKPPQALNTEAKPIEVTVTTQHTILEDVEEEEEEEEEEETREELRNDGTV